VSTITERVAAGAAFLDEHNPGWEGAIDLEKLDLGSGDRCILGQTCPMETLTAWLGNAPTDLDDFEYAYHAQAQALTGLPSRGYRGDLEEWAAARGFNVSYNEPSDTYDALTREWKRVITERRAAS
jgi:hypothetical protein